MTAKELEKILIANGWIYDYTRGSHKYYKNPATNKKIPIPYHSGKDIAKGTLNSILKEAGLK